MDRSPGVRVAAGRYVLGERLGGGGMSDVYRAVDTVLRRPVAVKLFRPGTDPIAERRFREEARLLGPLAHPALVTIYDTGAENGRAYQVLQLVDGVTLRHRLLDGPLGPAEVTRIGAQLADALRYVHSRGIVHRDVKPSNVLCDGTDVYLADFGVSRLLGDAHLTAAGLAVGTAAYMAPEQVQGREVDPAADIYSLGLVLLECLTGRREYVGGTMEVAVARLSRPPLVSTSFPAPLPSLLAAMTRDDPGQRPTASACAAALRDGDATVAVPTLPAAPTAVPTAVPTGPAPLVESTDAAAWRAGRAPGGPRPVEVPTGEITAVGAVPAPDRPRRHRAVGALAALVLLIALVAGSLVVLTDFAHQGPRAPGTGSSPSPGGPNQPGAGNPNTSRGNGNGDQGQNTGRQPGTGQNTSAKPTPSPSPVTSSQSPAPDPTGSPTASPSSPAGTGDGEQSGGELEDSEAAGKGRNKGKDKSRS